MQTQTITNSKLLQYITDLRNEISEQTVLLEKITKLETVDIVSINTLKLQIQTKIIDLKHYQYIIQKNNFDNTVIYKDKDYCVFELIKIKEKYIMEMQLSELIVKTESKDEKFLHLALKSYQEVIDYKKAISEIQSILNKFNNTFQTTLDNPKENT